MSLLNNQLLATRSVLAPKPFAPNSAPPPFVSIVVIPPPRPLNGAYCEKPQILAKVKGASIEAYPATITLE